MVHAVDRHLLPIDRGPPPRRVVYLTEHQQPRRVGGHVDGDLPRRVLRDRCLGDTFGGDGSCGEAICCLHHSRFFHVVPRGAQNSERFLRRIHRGCLSNEVRAGGRFRALQHGEAGVFALEHGLHAGQRLRRDDVPHVHQVQHRWGLDGGAGVAVEEINVILIEPQLGPVIPADRLVVIGRAGIVHRGALQRQHAKLPRAAGVSLLLGQKAVKVVGGNQIDRVIGGHQPLAVQVAAVDAPEVSHHQQHQHEGHRVARHPLAPIQHQAGPRNQQKEERPASIAAEGALPLFPCLLQKVVGRLRHAWVIYGHVVALGDLLYELVALAGPLKIKQGVAAQEQQRGEPEGDRHAAIHSPVCGIGILRRWLGPAHLRQAEPGQHRQRQRHDAEPRLRHAEGVEQREVGKHEPVERLDMLAQREERHEQRADAEGPGGGGADEV